MDKQDYHSSYSTPASWTPLRLFFKPGISQHPSVLVPSCLLVPLSGTLYLQISMWFALTSFRFSLNRCFRYLKWFPVDLKQALSKSDKAKPSIRTRTQYWGLLVHFPHPKMIFCSLANDMFSYPSLR